MATEILRPQDCLHGRIRSSPSLFPRRKGCNYGNSYSNGRAAPNPGPTSPGPTQKHHSPARSDHKRRSGHHEPRRSPGSDDGGRIGLAMEKVTILRRGSSLDSKIRSSVKSPKDGAGPDPAAMYAGSAFAVSPEPSSLPLPSFLAESVFTDSATRNIRKMLQLE